MREENAPLAPLSTFGVGGCAAVLWRVRQANQLLEATQEAKAKQLPVITLGGGSNILFPDADLAAAVIRLENDEIKTLENGTLRVGAGTKNAAVYAAALANGRNAAAFGTIPGTVGGAVAGSAGAWGWQVADSLVGADIFDQTKQTFRRVSADFFHLSYRQSRFHGSPAGRSRYLIWNADFHFSPATAAQIQQDWDSFQQKRQERQPVGRTGGSFFKNPDGDAAGRLLDAAGFRGAGSPRGAHFSAKHANFMMNGGQATASDILHLAHRAQAAVRRQFGVWLRPEVRIIRPLASPRRR